MKRKPLASFVIPVFNGAAYLAEAIRSVINQSLNRIEVVIVNDGSTDSTQRIIDYYVKQDNRIIPIHLETNQGRSNARNEGIRNTNTDILLMMDADDISLEKRAADTVKFFQKNPGIDIVSGHFYKVDGLGKPIEILENNNIALYGNIPLTIELVKETKFCHIGHSTMAFRKKVFDKVLYTDGPYSTNGIDDWKFQVDALKAGFKFGICPKIMTQYRDIPKKRDEPKILELKELCLN